MRKLITWSISAVALVVAALAFVWFANPFEIRDRIIVSQIVKMRVAPARLENIKTPEDYGMEFANVDIVTADNIRLSAWEIPAQNVSNKTIIVNHPLTTTRYGSDAGLDGVWRNFSR